MNNTDDIAIEIRKFLQGDCSPQEFDHVVSMLKDSNQNLGLRNILFKTWNELEPDEYNLSEKEKSEIRNALSGIHHQINLTNGKWSSKSDLSKITTLITRIAAIFLLPVIVISIWYYYTSRKPYKYNDSFITISTPEGSKIKSELPDGTIIWQNSGSTIQYPRNFTRRNRQVILTGEAFFDVKSDKIHPFHVKTGELMVTVTGTRFNVSGYQEDRGSTIVLESGEIKVRNTAVSGSGIITLHPGDRLESRSGKGDKVFHNTDVQKHVSWIDGKLIFRDDPFGEIMKKLERWYNVDIEINDPERRFVNLPFTMTIQYESLPQILEYLRRAAPFTIREESLSLKADGGFRKPKYIIEYRIKN
jgi:ferric-dicitrate binding protein FerR (iron transport regulator)